MSFILKLRTLNSELLTSFHDHSHALASTDAEGRKTKRNLPPFHFVQEGDDQPRTRASNGMAKGDPAAVNIRLFEIKLELPYTGDRLGSKGLI
jgi:hypothetical protein